MVKEQLGIALLVLSLVTVGFTTQSVFAGVLPPGGFQGDFDPANWTFFTEGNGFVDTTGAPDSIMLVGSNSGDEEEEEESTCGDDNFCPTDFTIPIPENGYVQFSWNYVTFDSPFFDPAGFLIDGQFFELTDEDGDNEQSGFVIVPVNQGDVFGFRVDSTDDCCGLGEFTEIFDFMFIPENDGAYVSSGNSFGENLDAGSIGFANLNTGDTNQIGQQIVIEAGISGLTFDSNGNLLGSSVIPECFDCSSSLYQIDPVTGEGTLINTIGIIGEGTFPLKIRDLATQPGTDLIFGVGHVVEAGAPSECDTFNSLFTIDPTDATADCIGEFEGVVEGDIGGIAFSPDGTLFVTANSCFDPEEFCGDFLASFNPDASFAGFFQELDQFLTGLGINPSDGGFFGTSPFVDTVYNIDLETGDTSGVAGFGDALSDIAFFPFNEPLTIQSGGNTGIYQNPTLGELYDGRLILSNGFCFDKFCMDVTDYFNHLPIRQVNSGSSHTISLTAYCSAGSNRCNYASVGAAPPGTDINSVKWNVILQRTGNTNDWQVTKNDPDGMLGDITGTVQIVDASRIQYTFNIRFITPASIGTPDGNAEPPENNLILVTEIRDSNGGVGRNIFNEGIFVNDIYAYPHVDALYASPVKVEQLCLNEDPTDRNTCAFEQVRQWTIKQAEEKLKEINERHHTKTD